MSKIFAVDVKTAQIKRGFHHIWQVIRELDKTQTVFTATDITQKCSAGADSDVRDYLKRLVLAQFIEPVRFGQMQGYKLVRRQLAYPRIRRDGTLLPMKGQQHMWNAIRQLKWFSAQDLAIASTTDCYQPTRATAQAYLRKLVQAGYLSVRETGKLKSHLYRLKPTQNTGPQAPLILRTKVVFDPNLNKLMETISAQEESNDTA
ncbi:hypothetical protein [Polycladidibacter stylochi]|uniref:hypothetical protein n=1 Tax=Polycladidibacter stylochi TaxID=1807766 RepID=UPI00082E5C47|nr:hypothetical protein [Pseudovibrio stylochi]